MNNILGCLPKDESCRTKESKRYKKDCYDFKPLNDGTKVGEVKYCQHSMDCQQVDFDAFGKTVPMEAHIYPVADIRSGQILEHRMLCTGKLDRRPLEERKHDEEAS